MRGTQLSRGPSRRRRFVLSGLVGLDALTVLLGTFGVWLILGFAEFDGDVPDWISPALQLARR